MKTTTKITKVAELDSRIAPGFSKLWRAIKASCRTSARCPRYVDVTDEPTELIADDHDCARRFAVDLATMTILSEVHVSCGEWATANRGQERAIVDIPANQAVVSCNWSDYYHYFIMTIEVAKGTLPAQVVGAVATLTHPQAPAEWRQAAEKVLAESPRIEPKCACGHARSAHGAVSGACVATMSCTCNHFRTEG